MIRRKLPQKTSTQRNTSMVVMVVGWIMMALVIIVLGWVVFVPEDERMVSREVRMGRGVALTNPLIDYEIPSTEDPSFLELRRKIVSVIDTYTNNRSVSNVSVYFRSLDEGLWFGIDEDQEYRPASLLKVPLLLVYLKLAGDDPLILKESIVYDGSFDHRINLPERFILLPDTAYTIEELLKRMIVFSDNVAREVLTKHLAEGWDVSMLNKAMQESDLIVPVHFVDDQYMVSPRSYSGIFRVLYNATYLSREMSERALEILGNDMSDGGIVRGLPEGVVAAHKFGYGGDIDNPEDHQVHDCGIVYADSSPYILCVFTRAASEKAGWEVIADISGVVFEDVTTHR